MITQERLKELLHYDTASGLFTWLVRRGGIKAGTVAGTLDKDGYVRITIARRRYAGHRLAWLYQTGMWPEHQIDHRDLDPKNNAFDNLREATGSQNQANKRGIGATGFKGVCKNAYGYQAQVNINGKPRYLGTFPTPEAAHSAYVAAANDHYGEYARSA